MKNRILFFMSAIFLYIVGTSSLPAAVQRPVEAAIVLGSECSGFLGRPIAGIRVLVYDAATTSWSPIPFQVDEFKEKAGTPGAKEVDWSGDGQLTVLDEIVFMANDLKDQAPKQTIWPNDEDSKANPRYEIVGTDPQTGEKGYGYIFYSSTLPKSNLSYMRYKNDRIYGLSYGIAHHSDVASGFPDSLAIVGNNVDILENWRIRAFIKKLSATAKYQGQTVTFTGNNIHFWEKMKDYNITLSYGWFNIILKVTAFHDVSGLLIKDGPVRIIRRHVMGIKLFNNQVGIDDTSRIPITTMYYPHLTEFEPSFSLNLGDMVKELQTDYLSFSQAFSSNSMNIKFYGNGFVSSTGTRDSLIDRSPGNTIFTKSLSVEDWPGNHWYGFSGRETTIFRNASIVTICTLLGKRIAPVRAPALYFFDYKSSFPDNTIPVYGDAGLQVYDWKKTTAEPYFSIDVRFRSYYLPQNMTRQQMQAFYDKYVRSMTISSSGQIYVPPVDTTPPARIADLRIIDRGETSVTLSWTAPGDDDLGGGPAWYYVIRYSTVPPNDPPGGFDWNWWGSATTVSAPPPPAQPGQIQTLTISGLSPATIYYFRMNVVDHAKNTSGLSNVASVSTTPVELASFTARLLPTRQVLLQWRTESESNNLGFAVQRRTAESGEWAEIGFAAGAGTTAEGRDYSFIDSPPIGSLYYRLKQIDADGSFQYSHVAAVTLTAPRDFALQQNYPNPFNPSTTITYQIPKGAGGRITLVVYDLLGRRVRSLVEQEAETGYYTVIWDGCDDEGRPTPTGVYIYQLQAADYSATRKMIKVQ